MARTISAIEADIYSKLALYPDLYAALSSISDTAVYRNFVSLTAQVVFEQEVSYDLFLVNLQKAILKQVVGTLPWYVAMSKLYQYGIALEDLGDGQLGYTSIDSDLQIVKYIAATEAPGIVRLKVAKDNSGVPEKISTAELANFREFWENMDFSPTFLSTGGGSPATELDNITSIDGDILELTYTAQLSPSIFVVESDTPADIGNNLVTGDKTVEDTIETYLRGLDLVEFGETFYLSGLIDAVMSIEGVENITFSVARAATAAAPTSWTDILAASGRKYSKESGYFADIDQTPTYE